MTQPIYGSLSTLEEEFFIFLHFFTSILQNIWSAKKMQNYTSGAM
jgi:hypothetical protein